MAELSDLLGTTDPEAAGLPAGLDPAGAGPAEPPVDPEIDTQEISAGTDGETIVAPDSPAPTDDSVESTQVNEELPDPEAEPPTAEEQPDVVEPDTEIKVEQPDVEVSLEDRMLNFRLSLARGEDPTLPKKIRMKIGNTEIIVNHVGAGKPTQKEIQTAVANYRASPEFENIIDKETGSPGRVRLAVGSAQTPEDKLATLRRFYPDAVAYKGDNFVYTDPNNGKVILHNPEGLDAGDVAGSAREITQAVGSSLGAAAGAVSGLATGPGAVVTSPTLAVIGAGAGNAIAGSLFDAMAAMFGLTVDTRSLTERTLDTAVEVGSGAIGQRAGDLVAPLTQKALGGGKAGAKALFDKFKALNIDPPAGAATGSRALGSIEKSLESAPGSATVIQDAAENTIKQTKAAVDKVISKFGVPKSVQGAGEVIRNATVAAAKRFGNTQEKVYNKVWDLVGARTPVAMNSIRTLRETLEDQLADAPGSLAKTLNPAIKQLKTLEADAAKTGGLIFERLRQIRTDIGKDLGDPVFAGGSSSTKAAQKLIYGALTEDMSAAASKAGPDAAHALKVADRFNRKWMNTTAQTLEKINKFDADERALGFALQASKDGGTALGRLRRNFEPDEWDTVAATVLHRMGMATPGAQNAAGDAFSVSTFMTSWSKMAPEAKQALFGGTRYKEAAEGLETLIQVTSSLKGIEKLTNTSNTARNMIAFSTISTLGGALGGLAGGDTSSIGAGVVSTIVAPRVAAKLITNPKFIKWLVTPITQPSKIAAHITRLAAIAKGEPAIKEEIHQYLQVLRGAPAQTNPDTGVAQ
jgi:hypothetical protein